MDLKLANQTALVSASSGGIGEAIALSLAAEGVCVIVNGRSATSVEGAMANIMRACPLARLLPLVADLGTVEGARCAIETYPQVDILVNNLGIYEVSEFFKTSDEQWQRLIEVNVMSGIRLSRHYLAGMLSKDSGRVIFICSESGVNPAPEMAHYSATKTMQMSVSRNLAEMTKGSNVTVNAVLPGPVRTEGVEKFIVDLFKSDFDSAETKFMSENRPTSLIQRLTRPEEIGDFVAFLASPRASAVNGAALRVDGGMIRTVF
jgi:3-oxoacyl-[acyl-carrier protein] reductase